MSYVGDSRKPRGPGILPLQHHNFEQSGFSIESRASVLALRIIDRQDKAGQLGHWVYDENSVGDITGALLWSKDTRSIHTWQFATPSVVVESSKALPIANPQYLQDARFKSLQYAEHPNWNKFPIGYDGIILSTTQESTQNAVFMAADPRLIASNRGKPQFSTLVADVTPEDRIDITRQAPLHTLARIVHKNGQGNEIALHITKPHGLVYDSGIIGALSKSQGGFIDTGTSVDIHRLQGSLDNESINSAHISTQALFTDGGTKDAPLLFEGAIAKESSLPFKSKAHLVFDPNMQHTHVASPKNGMWRWQVESAFYRVDETDIQTPHPIRKWQTTDSQQTYLATTMPIATPSVIARPQPPFGHDLRDDPNPSDTDVETVDCFSPITARREAWARYNANEFIYTDRAQNAGSRFKSGTASGGFMTMPPELDIADWYEWNKSLDETPPQGRSTVYDLFTPDAWFAVGTPDFASGRPRSGFAWSYSVAANELQFDYFEAGTRFSNQFGLRAGGRIFWKDGTNFNGVFAHANTADRTYTFPDRSGLVIVADDGTTGCRIRLKCAGITPDTIPAYLLENTNVATGNTGRLWELGLEDDGVFTIYRSTNGIDFSATATVMRARPVAEGGAIIIGVEPLAGIFNLPQQLGILGVGMDPTSLGNFGVNSQDNLDAFFFNHNRTGTTTVSRIGRFFTNLTFGTIASGFGGEITFTLLQGGSSGFGEASWRFLTDAVSVTRYEWQLGFGGASPATIMTLTSDGKWRVGDAAIPSLATAEVAGNMIVVGSVAIGNFANAHPSSFLDLNGTTKGFLTARVTTVQRNAIVSPATSLLVFNTDTTRFNYFNGTAWNDLGKSSNHITFLPRGGGTNVPPVAATTNSATFQVRARTLIDFSRFSDTTVVGQLMARGRVNLGSGEIRIFNVTDGVQMALISYTETTDTTKTAALSSIPTSGIKEITIEIRRITAGTTITIEACSADFLVT